MPNDAVDIKPKFVPKKELMPRDNSGGSDMPSLNKSDDFGDGGKVTGPKAALSASSSK